MYITDLLLIRINYVYNILYVNCLSVIYKEYFDYEYKIVNFYKWQNEKFQRKKKK